MNSKGHSFPGTLPVLSALFVNGLAGGFVWPYLPILLSDRGLHPDRIGLVLGTASLLILLFRLPLGRLLDWSHLPDRWIRIILLVPFPCTLLLTIHAGDPVWLITAIFLLHLARMPFLPLGLACLKRLSEKRKVPFSPLIFVGSHHLFLGVLGLLAGWVVLLSGLHKTLLLVVILMFAGSLPLLFQSNEPPPDRISSPKTPRILPERAEGLVLSSFFLLHLVNAPLLPFTELYMKRQTSHGAWIPWIAAIAELTMVATAIALFRNQGRFESRWMIMIASGVLALRMLLYSTTPSAAGILWISLLDGLTSGIFWMVGIGWVALRMEGRGEFNQLAGFVDIAVVTGGAAGTLLFGWAVSRWGFPGACGRLAPLNLLAPLCLILAGRNAWHTRSPVISPR